VETKVLLHLRLLQEDAFRSGEYHAGYLKVSLNGG